MEMQVQEFVDEMPGSCTPIRDEEAERDKGTDFETEKNRNLRY